MNRLAALTLGVILLGSGLTLAQQTPLMSQAEAQPIEVGNKICPVSGNKVGEMGPPIKFTYNGKVYNLCCPMCIKSFKHEPKKYSKIAEDGVKAEKKQ